MQKLMLTIIFVVSLFVQANALDNEEAIGSFDVALDGDNSEGVDSLEGSDAQSLARDVKVPSMGFAKNQEDVNDSAFVKNISVGVALEYFDPALNKQISSDQQKATFLGPVVFVGGDFLEFGPWLLRGEASLSALSHKFDDSRGNSSSNYRYRQDARAWAVFLGYHQAIEYRYLLDEGRELRPFLEVNLGLGHYRLNQDGHLEASAAGSEINTDFSGTTQQTALTYGFGVGIRFNLFKNFSPFLKMGQRFFRFSSVDHSSQMNRFSSERVENLGANYNGLDGMSLFLGVSVKL